MRGGCIAVLNSTEKIYLPRFFESSEEGLPLPPVYRISAFCSLLYEILAIFTQGCPRDIQKIKCLWRSFPPANFFKGPWKTERKYWKNLHYQCYVVMLMGPLKLSDRYQLSIRHQGVVSCWIFLQCHQVFLTKISLKYMLILHLLQSFNLSSERAEAVCLYLCWARVWDEQDRICTLLWTTPIWTLGDFLNFGFMCNWLLLSL